MLVEVFDLGQHGFGGECLLAELLAALTHFGGGGGVVGHLDHGVAEGLGVAGFYEEAGGVVGVDSGVEADFACAVAVVGDHGDAGE